MPLFKGVASLAKPKKAIDYITKEEKAVLISIIALDDQRDYATQFKETCDLFGKGRGRDERKYYHFKLSCDPKDNPTPQQSHALAEQIASELFGGHECVIATHTDTDVFHSHIIINAVNFETGKKFRMWNGAYSEAKDLADILGESMGFTKLDWRAKAEAKHNRIHADEAISPDQKHISNAERNIAKRDKEGGQSWKEALRQSIDEAKAICTDRATFQIYLKETYGIDMPRNTTKTVSFDHPAVGETKAIRGTTLGSAYTAESIDIALNENNERSVSNARLLTQQENRNEPTNKTDSDPSAIPIYPTTESGNGECIITRSISDISAELRAIDETVQYLIEGDTGVMVTDQLSVSQPTTTDRDQRSEPSQAIETVREPQHAIHQQIRRRSQVHER